MAKVMKQSVPPSLQEAYDRLLYTANGPVLNRYQVAVQPTARAAEPTPKGSPLAQLASSAAAWLRDQWHPSAESLTRSLFYRERRAEILGGIFPTEYWYQASQLNDQTEYATPIITEWVKPWNPGYWDPLRQPSKCIYNKPTTTYATPEDRGSPSQPAPGWAGSVHGVQWQDDWMTERKLTFSLPIALNKPKVWRSGLPPQPAPRPIAIRADVTIEASATIRGNRTWFALTTNPAYWANSPYEPQPPKMLAHWNREDGYPYEVPSDMPGGWSHTITRTVIRSGYHTADWRSITACTRCTLRIATPPSLGMYYSRNDAVSVYHHGSAAIYIARGPNG